MDGVDLDRPLVVDFEVDEVDTGVLVPELHGAVARRHQIVEGPDRETEVVHARTAHGVVLGDEEDELVPVHARQDQSLAVEGHRRHLVEAEHLSPEATDVGPVGLVEKVTGDADRDMVEVRITRGVIGMCHQSPSTARPSVCPGTTMTLPAIRPSARPCMASPRRSSGTSSGSMRTSTGN